MSRSSTAWEDLPESIMETVFAFLPMHDLCHARVVCKTWRHAASQPSLAVLRASTPRPISTVLISPRSIDITDIHLKTEWEVLDAAENQSYTLLDAFILDHYDRDDPVNLLLWFHQWTKYTLAANGGLVYTVFDRIGRESRIQIVCNPVSKSFHEIVEPWSKSRSSYERDIVVMSVDNATNAYKIITMDVHGSARVAQPIVLPRREELHLYDSTTSVWKRLCKFPEQHYRAISGIFMNGVFYALFMDLSEAPWSPLLFTCDLATGAWSHIDMDLPRPTCLQDKSQLVVVSSRLFIVEYTGVLGGLCDPPTNWELQLTRVGLEMKYLIDVSIWEIVLATDEVVKVVEMTKFSRYHKNRLGRSSDAYDTMVAVGCVDSIVISCTMGRRVAFDLPYKCWRELQPYRPRNAGIFDYVAQGVCGALVDF